LAYQPISIIATLTGELIHQLRTIHPNLKIWTTVKQINALTAQITISYGFEHSAIGQIDLRCTIPEENPHQRIIEGQCHATLPKHWLKPDITDQEIQDALQAIADQKPCAIRYQTGFSTIGPATAQINEINIRFQPLHYQFNHTQEHPDLQGYAQNLAQDAATWIQTAKKLTTHQK